MGGGFKTLEERAFNEGARVGRSLREGKSTDQIGLLGAWDSIIDLLIPVVLDILSGGAEYQESIRLAQMTRDFVSEAFTNFAQENLRDSPLQVKNLQSVLDTYGKLVKDLLRKEEPLFSEFESEVWSLSAYPERGRR